MAAEQPTSEKRDAQGSPGEEQVTDCPYCDFTSDDKREHANHVLSCDEREVAA